MLKYSAALVVFDYLSNSKIKDVVRVLGTAPICYAAAIDRLVNGGLPT